MIRSSIPAPIANPRRTSLTLANLCLGASLMTLGLAGTASAGTLNLDEALSRAVAYTPSQRAAQARIEAAEATARQAAVKPPAAIGLDIENLGGEAEGGLDRTETTLSYQHTLERGGKREARVNAARSEIRVAELRRQVAALDLIYTVEKLWVEATAAEAEVALAESQLAISRTAQAEVQKRVAVARDPLFAGTEVDTAVARAQLDLDLAKAKTLRLRQELAAYWGGAADFELSRTSLETVSAADSSTGPATTIDVALLEAERQSATARIRVEETRKAPDATVSGGVRHFGADGTVAVVLGGAIPLGRAGYNQGGIDRARAERRAVEADIEARRLDYLRQRSQLLGRMNSYSQEIRRIEADILPPAEKTLDQVSDGYRRGGFRHTDVINAARIIQTVHVRRIEVLKAMNLDLAALHRLDGHHAGLVPAGDIRQ